MKYAKLTIKQQTGAIVVSRCCRVSSNKNQLDLTSDIIYSGKNKQNFIFLA